MYQADLYRANLYQVHLHQVHLHQVDLLLGTPNIRLICIGLMIRLRPKATSELGISDRDINL